MWILLLILGVIFTIFPKVSWYISNFWKFQDNAQPSSTSLIIYRIGGIVWIIIGIVLYIKK